MGCELSLGFSVCPSCLAGGHKELIAFSHLDMVEKGRTSLAIGDLLVPLKAAKSMICLTANLV